MTDSEHPLERLERLDTLAFRRVGSSVPLPVLVAGARQGQAQFIGELYRRFWKDLLAFAQRLAPDDAEDIVQEVFLKLPTALAGYEERGTFEPWLKRVAFNVYRTRRRSTELRREDALDPDTESPAPELGRVTREDLWSHALTGMPSGLRDVWVLHREGYQAREIADLVGISTGAAATRLSRARDYLTSRLGDRG